ncbi:DUF3558 family protein [Saccharomonospora sp. CUA-673]|uniref:DUF3558 family protein n=1 Tax=Saccharomonospora sp. CUA-673 TaxID=1904969 RepID=UPI00210087C5
MVGIIALSGCSDAESGTPEADNAPPSTPPAATSAAPSAPNGELSQLDPCSLLEMSEIQPHADVDEPQPSESGTARVCTWPATADGTAERKPTVGGCDPGGRRRQRRQ